MFNVILPILNEQKIKAIFFVNNHYIGNNEMFYKHNLSLLVKAASNSSQEKKENICKLLKCENNLVQINNRILKLNFKEEKLITELNFILEVNPKNYLSKQKPYLDEIQLKKIIEQGHYLGGHTVRHFPLELLDFDQQISEIVDSIAWLKKQFGLKYELFAFPFSDASAKIKLFEKLFEQFPNLICMGNAGMRKDFSSRVVQRFSLENPKKPGDLLVRTNILYKYFNIISGKGKVKRN